MHILGMHMVVEHLLGGPPGLLEPWNAQQVFHHFILADGATCPPLHQGSWPSVYRSRGRVGEHGHIHAFSRLPNIILLR